MMIEVATHLCTIAVAFWASTLLLKGMKIDGGVVTYVILAAGFGLLSFLLAKLLFVLVGVVSLGVGFLFAFAARTIVNAILLKLLAALSSRMTLKGLVPAIAAALILAGVETLADWLFRAGG